MPILKLHIAVKIDLVEEVYYLKQVFHLLYDKSVMPVEALFSLSLIVLIVVYDI